MEVVRKGGSVKSMRVFVYEELINDLRVNINKIDYMFGQMNKQNYEAFLFIHLPFLKVVSVRF